MGREQKIANDPDPLLTALMVLARHYGRGKSEQALCAGLPGVDEKWTASLFVRAAGRAGFAARVVKRRLSQLSEELLPAVVVLDNHDARVLFRFDGDKAVVGSSLVPGGLETLSKKDLLSHYSGYCILVRPSLTHEAPVGEMPLEQTSWFWGSVRKSWWIYGQVVMAAILINIFALVTPLFMMTVYDRVIPNNAMETMWVLAIGAMLVFGFDFLIRTLRGYFVDVAGTRADVLAARRIFDHLLDVKMGARRRTVGATSNTMKEFETVRDFMTSATLVTVVDMPFVVFFAAMISFVGGPLGLVTFVLLPILLLLGVLIQGPLEKRAQMAFKETEMKQSILVEALAGLETLKAVGGQSRIRAKWEKAVVDSARAAQSGRSLSYAGVNFTLWATQFANIAVVVIGVFLVQDGSLTQGQLIAAVILTGRAMAPMSQVANLMARYSHVVEAYRSIANEMKLPVERPLERNFLSRPILDGKIEFRGTSFAYPGAEMPALKGANFTIKPGEKVAFVGKLGTGKTTILKLLLGLYEPTGGVVLVDDVDIRQIDPIDLRKAMGYVPQDVVLFGGSLRDNIALGYPQADDAAILAAARTAGVDAWASQHPKGYDLVIGERGEGLSGGQRQAVAIARALVHEPVMLLMDEPTSNMDNRTEHLFKEQMAKYLAGRTCLLVTHRASLLDVVDRIIVIDNGLVAADGPRDDVLKMLQGGGQPQPAVPPQAAAATAQAATTPVTVAASSAPLPSPSASPASPAPPAPNKPPAPPAPPITPAQHAAVARAQVLQNAQPARILGHPTDLPPRDQGPK